jgi:hypothetical protein
MPGLILYDLGDMIRSGTNSASESETDLSKVWVRQDIFEALVRGFTETAGGFMTRAEREHLAFSGKLITFEIGLRFLTDFLSGDVYFKINRPRHNLDRCRTQFKLVDDMERNEAQLESLADRLLGRSD